MNPPSSGHRAPALWLLLPLMAGLIAGRARLFTWEPGWLLAAALIATCLALFVTRAWYGAVVAGAFLAGMGVYSLDRSRLPEWESLPPREAQVTVRVDRIFASSSEAGRISGLGRITDAEPHLQDLVGQRIFLSATPANREIPLRSTEIEVLGVLQLLPFDPPIGSFDHYLASAGINFRLTRAQVIAMVRPPSAYRAFCHRALIRLDAILQAGLADKPRLSGSYRAMLLGQKHELSDEQDDVFMRSGTMHLFAISGLHITAIGLCIQVVLALIRLPRAAQFVVGLIALWLFTDITGGTPSAVRAFIMTTLFTATTVLRVPGNPLASLAVSALIVIALAPMQVFSASFQLSYGIVAALLIMGVPLADAWNRRLPLFESLPEAMKTWKHRSTATVWTRTVTAVALGLAATLMGTLSTVSFFQLVTPGSLLANLLLIPISIGVVFAGCASLGAGLLGGVGLSVVFNHAAALMLAVIEAIVRGYVWLPGSNFSAAFRQDWMGPFAVVALLVVMVHGYVRRWEPRAGGFWPPFVLVGIVLVVGVRYG